MLDLWSFKFDIQCESKKVAP